MKTSAAGIALIKKFEGCRLVAYRDTRGTWTIGYGETGSYVVPGLHYTQQQAEDGLAMRLANEFEPGIMAALDGAPVTQPQFDALASLEWNIGVGRIDNPDTPENEASGLKGSSVIRFHRGGDYMAAANAFRLWNKSAGVILPPLVTRREAERALYLSVASAPVYGDIDPDLVADIVRALQRVVGADPDGIFGPHTAAAITAAQTVAK